MKIRRFLCIIILYSFYTVLPANSFTDFFKPDFSTGDTNTKKAEKTASEDSKDVGDSASDTTTQSRKNIRIVKGNIYLDVHGKAGTFGIYIKDSEGNIIPVISDFDEYSSSFFGLETESSFYKLNNVNGIYSTASGIDNAAILEYTVSNFASVKIVMTCIASEEGKKEDTIRFDVTTSNISGKEHVMGLRCVFDTVLGENSSIHFSTDKQKRIDTESILSPLDGERWISTSDGKNSAVFIFSGNGLPRPDEVYLANKDVLGQPVWEPSIAKGRSFNSVISYNNSAIGFTWQLVKLMPSTSFTKTFYIVTGADNMQPRTAQILASLDKVPVHEKEAPEETAVSPKEPELPGTKQAAADTSEEKDIIEDSEQKINDAEFDVDSITADQLDPVYIQNLIDKINALEVEDEGINREELLRLNAELDAILEKLRQRK